MYDRYDELSAEFLPPSEVAELTAEERANTIAGRYEIVERIGEGGMGQIVRVRHRRLGKQFAMKLMQAEMSSNPAVRDMFQREAKLASALSHQNIVSIVDFGEDPDWGLFIVMELLDGEPLSQRIAARPLAVELACDVARQLADALHHSHMHGVVHGDVKSENVVCVTAVEQEKERWNVKLLDFGTAQLGTRPGLDARISGTPEYVAPERIQGEPPRPTNDIYALGVVLYEMLAGHAPFVGEPADVLRSHLSTPHESVAAARSEVLDDALVAIVDRALAKDPSDRFEDALEFRTELDAYMTQLGMRQRAMLERLDKPERERIDATAAAFDAMPIPAAGLSANGMIVVANPSFARLLNLESRQDVEGENILDTPLGQLHPELRDDLRLVAMDGRIVRRRLTVPARGGTEHLVRLVMVPTAGPSGHCLIILHSLPRE